MDGEATDSGDEQERRGRVRTRWTNTCSLLLARLDEERTAQLRRAILATIARALDALVRDVAADAADILLFAAVRVRAPLDLEVLAEASMQPDVTQLVQAYARFVRKLDPTPPPPPSSSPNSLIPISSIPVSSFPASSGGIPSNSTDRDARGEAGIAALEALIGDLPTGATQRTEVVRGALSRLSRALAAVHASRSLSALASTSGDSAPLTALDDALAKLGQLTAGARRRCGDDPEDLPQPSEMGNRISQGGQRPESPVLVAIRRALNNPDLPLHNELDPAVHELLATVDRAIPPALAGVVATVVSRVVTLPLDRPSSPAVTSVPEQSLPAWLPPRRTLGGFYVHRQLGGGSLGTVFVVTRAEERHDPHAERFALKVPDYDATAARSVSEADFLKLFREEAGALLSVPEHKNLARFVTFDAGARPKPILVMELIEGIRCDQLLASRGFTMPAVIEVIDGVLAGLEAMHSVEVGHLDVKPSNVVLRGGKEPVLVDFGLAGRHIRPGCATASYGAPEVWGITPDGVTPTPLTADIYAFGCVAYELLTASALFDDPNEVAIISAHLMHDGLPGPVRKMTESPKLEPLGMFLFNCLRHSPDDRATATELRETLKGLANRYRTTRWPIDAG
jgi:hypothetical protein